MKFWTVVAFSFVLTITSACMDMKADEDELVKFENETAEYGMLDMNKASLARRPQLVVPSAIEDVAVALLPSEAVETGYALHYRSLGADNRHERYRVSYSLLEVSNDDYTFGDFRYAVYLGYNRETGEVAKCSRLTCPLEALAPPETSGWSPLTQDASATSSRTLVVRFFEHPDYSGDSYSLYADVTTSGVFTFSLPSASSVGMNDVWSSFYTIDAVCETCRVGEWAHNVFEVTVYKHTYFDGKSYNFDSVDSDSDFDNNRWYHGIWPQGKIDDEISSFKVKISIYSPQVVCGDDICEGDETASSCPQDCGYCGDNICYGSETVISCNKDCDGYCGDGICYGSETASSCRSDCGYCGDGVCYGIENSSRCPEDCDGGCVYSQQGDLGTAIIDPCIETNQTRIK